jgi:hypothetical protein
MEDKGIEDKINELVHDWLSEDEKFYGKMDGTESITKPIERFVQALTKLVEVEVQNFADWYGNVPKNSVKAYFLIGRCLSLSPERKKK